MVVVVDSVKVEEEDGLWVALRASPVTVRDKQTLSRERASETDREN